ncbi:dihydropteroate synthase [Variovorax sp. HJSM1_2]|uniref:dihydropteroate synthase n=1 Tax=Variovorax sp. HJSM1_2 TaxID=3366263 RepID=UPI003BC9AAB8
MYWQTTRWQIDLNKPQVMGIVNVTPNSFSDGGQHATTASALQHCEALISQGVDILDIGAESTRPGVAPVSEALELERLLPVVREAVRLGVPVSIDTYKPAVMQAMLDLGVDIINDIWALRWLDPARPLITGAGVVSQYPGCGVCLMHMHGEPQTMQVHPMAGDIVPEVLAFLSDAADKLRAHGLTKAQIALDPGVGFGKTVAQNFSLLARQTEFLALGYPLLLGWSRKSSLAAMGAPLPGLPAGNAAAVHERMLPSVAAALLAVERGARIVRVHDVGPTVQALKVWCSATQIETR